MAYSFRPQCRFIGLNVPMQPRKRLSFPTTHVTNKGLINEGKLELETGNVLVIIWYYYSSLVNCGVLGGSVLWRCEYRTSKQKNPISRWAIYPFLDPWEFPWPFVRPCPILVVGEDKGTIEVEGANWFTEPLQQPEWFPVFCLLSLVPQHPAAMSDDLRFPSTSKFL